MFDSTFDVLRTDQMFRSHRNVRIDITEKMTLKHVWDFYFERKKFNLA